MEQIVGMEQLCRKYIRNGRKQAFSLWYHVQFNQTNTVMAWVPTRCWRWHGGHQWTRLWFGFRCSTCNIGSCKHWNATLGIATREGINESSNINNGSYFRLYIKKRYSSWLEKKIVVRQSMCFVLEIPYLIDANVLAEHMGSFLFLVI